ncbi:MAG: hypothetical protein ABSG91_23635 [Syntrophobacteraceae bacterium]|jgi:hypothetical protein
MEKGLERVPTLLAQLYAIVDELEASFDGRKFTPDGHLIGSIGEVIAAYMYGLSLLPSSSKDHDAETKDGRLVQIKFTVGTKSFSAYGQPDHLIALQLVNRKNVVEVFNGPGSVALECAGRKQKNGQRQMSIACLKKAMEKVAEVDRIRPINQLVLCQKS